VADRVQLPAGEAVFEGAAHVVAVLRDAGHEAWIVGGAVRDLLRGLRPVEYDIATSARPEAVMALFRRTVPVGVQFGVVRVRHRGTEYEVATFRADAGYSDGRRPDAVRFTDLREDVRRRDFTMNGLAMDAATGEVVDLVEGVADLRAGVIRAIGDPRARFAEDRLRPLRAVRFAAQTGFAIEPATLAAVRECAAEVAVVSAERVREELSRTLRSTRPGAGVRLLRDTGLLAVVLPDLRGAGADVGIAADLTLAGADVGIAADALDALAAAGAGEDARWAALLWELGPDGADGAMARLKQSNRARRATSKAIAAGLAMAGLPFADVAAEKRLLRDEGAIAGLAALAARVEATAGDPRPAACARARLAAWGPGDLDPPRLATGTDVMAAGVAPGPAVARALVALEDAQLRGTVTTREAALEFLQRLVPRS
jgi:poly(A) polymerase